MTLCQIVQYIIFKMAEGEGFEPPVPVRHAGFQDRFFKPLRHPSVRKGV